MSDGDPSFAIDRGAVRASFARAAATFDAAAVLHREVSRRMGERLDYVRLAPARILDAGCATGASLLELGNRYPEAAWIGLDVALPMLQQARRRIGSQRSWLRSLLGAGRDGRRRGAALVGGDLAELPLAGGSIDLVWSNLALHWCDDPSSVLAEFHRVTATGGLLMFSTLGPDTLKEVREAFAPTDRLPHVGRFVDMHDLGDMLVDAGFADPVMDMEQLSVTYRDWRSLMGDLRDTGSRNALCGRRRSLTGPRRWRRAMARLAPPSGAPLSITFEVVYGHAWREPSRKTADGHAIVRFARRPGR